MRHQSVLVRLAAGCVALAACAPDPTQPDTQADPAPAAPTLAVTHGTWIKRRSGATAGSWRRRW